MSLSLPLWLAVILDDDEELELMLLASQHQTLPPTRNQFGFIPRIALLDPHLSPWVKLYSSGSVGAMIILTGLDYATFHYLAVKFEVLYNKYTPYSGNGRIKIKPITACYYRPRLLDSRGCLALTLAFLRTMGRHSTLSMLFGTGSTVTSLFIKFGRRLFLRLVRSLSEAQVRMPSLGDIEFCKTVVLQKYPTLVDVWFTMDGLKLPIERASDFEVQQRYYNGWVHGHYVGNVLVFSSDGRIVACSVNNVGNMHDSEIAVIGGIYEKLDEQWRRCRGRGVVDSAFNTGSYNQLIKSGQVLPTNASELQILQQEEATSLRQSSEWGMRGFQSSFPRFYGTIAYEENGERLLMLLSAIYLFNIRARHVGLNQIQSVFMPLLRDHNVEEIYNWVNF